MEKFKAAWLKVKTFFSKRNIFIGVLLIIAICLISNLAPFLKDTCNLKTNHIFEKLFTYLATPAGRKDCTTSVGTLIERIGYIAGGLIALSVALATFQRAKAADKTAEAQIEATKAQNKTVLAQNKTADEQEKGNLEQRYDNAVNQLTHTEPSIRLAGFYGLYHLAQDNAKYRRTICDILCAYVRERTTNMITAKIEKSDKTENIFYKEKYSKEPDNEIQSIIDLLTNKKHEENYPFQSEWINLSRAYLVGANFNKSILNKAILEEAQLQGADLYRAQLRAAVLRRARLQGANLYSAQLQGTILYKVQLQGAELSSAQLQGVNLEESQMQGANLYSVQLQGAALSLAQMQGTHLRRAQLQGAYLSKVQLQGANLSDAQLQGANLSDAQLQGANLYKAQLQGAFLQRVQLQGAVLDNVNLIGAVAPKTYSYTDATEQLENRTGKVTDLRTVIFSGGASPKDIENFQKETQGTTTHLKDGSLEIFQNKMKRVIQILGEHNNKDDSNNFPPEGYTKISIEDYENPSKEKKHVEKYIITGTLDKATADKIIEELKDIDKEVAEINKKYSNI